MYFSNNKLLEIIGSHQKYQNNKLPYKNNPQNYSAQGGKPAIVSEEINYIRARVFHESLRCSPQIAKHCSCQQSCRFLKLFPAFYHNYINMPMLKIKFSYLSIEKNRYFHHGYSNEIYLYSDFQQTSGKTGKLFLQISFKYSNMFSLIFAPERRRQRKSRSL